jgi:hypothetical protein
MGPMGDPRPVTIPLADEIMVRSIDFSVKPDSTCRYRLRAVVSLGPKGQPETLGPWSEPTGEVKTPRE